MSPCPDALLLAARELERGANALYRQSDELLVESQKMRQKAAWLRDEAEARREAEAAKPWVGEGVRVSRKRRAA